MFQKPVLGSHEIFYLKDHGDSYYGLLTNHLLIYLITYCKFDRVKGKKVGYKKY